MAKLYAELTSDKGGRVASKGGDSELEITIKLKNETIAEIIVLPSGNIYCETYGSGDMLKGSDMKQLKQ